MLVTMRPRRWRLHIPAFDDRSPANNCALAEQPLSFMGANCTLIPTLQIFRTVLSMVDIVGEGLWGNWRSRGLSWRSFEECCSVRMPNKNAGLKNGASPSFSGHATYNSQFLSAEDKVVLCQIWFPGASFAVPDVAAIYIQDGERIAREQFESTQLHPPHQRQFRSPLHRYLEHSRRS